MMKRVVVFVRREGIVAVHPRSCGVVPILLHMRLHLGRRDRFVCRVVHHDVLVDVSASRRHLRHLRLLLLPCEIGYARAIEVVRHRHGQVIVSRLQQRGRHRVGGREHTWHRHAHASSEPPRAQTARAACSAQERHDAGSGLRSPVGGGKLLLAAHLFVPRGGVALVHVEPGLEVAPELLVDDPQLLQFVHPVLHHLHLDSDHPVLQLLGDLFLTPRGRVHGDAERDFVHQVPEVVQSIHRVFALYLLFFSAKMIPRVTERVNGPAGEQDHAQRVVGLLGRRFYEFPLVQLIFVAADDRHLPRLAGFRAVQRARVQKIVQGRRIFLSALGLRVFVALLLQREILSCSLLRRLLFLHLLQEFLGLVDGKLVGDLGRLAVEQLPYDVQPAGTPSHKRRPQRHNLRLAHVPEGQHRYCSPR
mmetsp:Transcript_11250/g.27499  ORF Transcript_11250/g.27499 Transcript_11250/m.27499 type:complete len:418 (-) Transcript_11250:721-1974(-)